MSVGFSWGSVGVSWGQLGLVGFIGVSQHAQRGPCMERVTVVGAEVVNIAVTTNMAASAGKE